MLLACHEVLFQQWCSFNDTNITAGPESGSYRLEHILPITVNPHYTHNWCSGFIGYTNVYANSGTYVIDNFSKIPGTNDQYNTGVGAWHLCLSFY